MLKPTCQRIFSVGCCLSVYFSVLLYLWTSPCDKSPATSPLKSLHEGTGRRDLSHEPVHTKRFEEQVAGTCICLSISVLSFSLGYSSLPLPSC